VPTTGQVAEVEIERQRGHINGDLATWRQRLLQPVAAAPSTAVPPPVPNEQEQAAREDVIRQLDSLYCEIGRLGINAALPNRLEAAQKAAQEASEELSRANRARVSAEQRRSEASSPTEAAKLGAEVSKSLLLERQAETNSRFTRLVLGREIASAGLCPRGAEQLLHEAEALRRQLV